MMKMNQYKRKDNTPVRMFKVNDPITLDKSSSWGDGNIQKHDDGCWVQLGEDLEVSHLVADDGKNNPVGWEPWGSGSKGCFVKKNVVAQQVKNKTKVTLKTLDGKMTYDNLDKDGWVVYNYHINGGIDWSDPWFMDNKKFTETYEPNGVMVITSKHTPYV